MAKQYHPDLHPGDAEAEANKKIAESLTPTLIDKIKYETWDGKLPTVSGSSSIISIDGIG